MIVEILVALTYGIEKLAEFCDVRVGGSAELICPLIKSCRIIDPQRAVRTKSRKHSCGRSAALNALVIFEGVSGIVSRTYGNYAEFLHNSLRAEFVFCELFVRALPNVFGSVLVEQGVDIEIALQLKMSPVI